MQKPESHVLFEAVELAAEGVLVDDLDRDELAGVREGVLLYLCGKTRAEFLRLETGAEAFAVLDAEFSETGAAGGVKEDHGEGHGAEERAATGFIDAVDRAHGATLSRLTVMASRLAIVVVRRRRASARGAEAAVWRACRWA